MFADYTTLVRRCYEEKKLNGTLSQRLIDPTPAQLKKQCLVIFSLGSKPIDRKALNLFFGEGCEGEVGLKAIKRCNRDKFIPLVRYLREETKTTDDKNIELLAWLIDFDERPFVYGKRYELYSIKSGKSDVSKDDVQEESSLTRPPSFSESGQQPMRIISNQTLNNKRFTSKAKTGIVSIILLALAGAVTYSLQKNNQESLGFVTIKTGEACMYWVGDHYEQTSCTQKHGDTLVVALDTLELRYLRKINTPDTITLNAIGKVWYIKTNNRLEYFTAAGNYPLDPKRKLKPISTYIIEKYFSR